MLAQIQRLKHKNNLWNLFKVKNKGTRTMSLTSFWCLYCWLWKEFTHCSGVSIVDFGQVNADAFSPRVSTENKNAEGLVLVMLRRCSRWIFAAQKMKFFIKDFFSKCDQTAVSKCDQICSFLRIWSHFLTKSLMKNFIFYAVFVVPNK